MPTDFAFRLSTYLSLGLACLCLGYSEWDLLPEVTGFTVAVMVLLGVSFWMEGKYAFSLSQANKMGAGIFVLAGGWLAFHYFSKGGLIHTLPWPAGLLPYLGPLLMVLMPAKLVRPKHLGDWWAMQGIGAVAVGLACSMSEDGIFAGLLITYTVVAVWSAVLFFHRRWAGAIPPVPGYPAGPTPDVVADPADGRRQLKAVATWAIVAAVVALPAFFLTPRSPSAKWQIKTKAETGYTGEPVVDLTTTGTLQINRDDAFTVTATGADGLPKQDLNPNTLWRGDSFYEYADGKWGKPTRLLTSLFTTPVNNVRLPRLADLGPDQFRLDYTPKPGLTRPVLAEPVAWKPDEPSPVASEQGGRWRPWQQYPDGWFVPANRAYDHLTVTQRRVDPYRQTTRLGPDPDLSPGNELLSIPDELRALPPNMSGTRRWSERLLEDLIRTGRLPTDAAEVDGPTRRVVVRGQHFEAVARAFQHHIAADAGFRYDLDLKRTDTSIDPVEDFLLNTRTGHCQRFASALALSLRGVGVPTAMVVGFKGCENDGDGKYMVRQDHAHAWVTVLVPRPAPPGPGVQPASATLWHWLSLDPTPGASDAARADAEEDGWLGTAGTAGRTFYSEFIIGYDLERRKFVVEWIRRQARENLGSISFGAVGLAGAILAVVLLRRFRRRGGGCPADGGSGIDWYDTMANALTAWGCPVLPGQTPGEHAAMAAAGLRTDPRTESVADVPVVVAAALYEIRYAGQPLNADRQAALAADVDRLVAALRAVLRSEASRG